MSESRPFIGRGAGFNPPNRFESLKVESPPPDLAEYFELPEPGQKVPTRFYVDRSLSILSKNDSPDIGFTYSINPYRGCEHGCIFATRALHMNTLASPPASILRQRSW